jgi:formate hydrogenlyase subunit 3/multisubunit Na+/H+ antiporter MnhD subunit
MVLFADQSEADMTGRTLAVAVIAACLLFFGYLVYVIARQVGRNRELAHLERLKAIESGQPTGPSEVEKNQSKFLHNVFWISFWIGAGVPIAATSAAASVLIQARTQEFPVVLAIWIGVAVISVASVICATTLMICGRRSKMPASYRQGSPSSKGQSETRSTKEIEVGHVSDVPGGSS